MSNQFTDALNYMMNRKLTWWERNQGWIYLGVIVAIIFGVGFFIGRL